MSDGLPSDEQLARIEQGVRARIRRRRSIRQGITGGAAAVLLLGGGIALVPHFGMSAGSSGGGGSAAGTSGRGGAVAATVVECHDSTAEGSAVRAEKVTGPLPGAALAACGYAATEFQSGTGTMPPSSTASDQASAAPDAASGQAESQPVPSPTRSGPAVVCRAADGALAVYPTADDGVCARNGSEPY